jgi:hypothetical protein
MTESGRVNRRVERQIPRGGRREPIGRRLAHSVMEVILRHITRSSLTALLLLSLVAPAVHAQSLRASVDALKFTPITTAPGPVWSFAPAAPATEPAGVRREPAQPMPMGAAGSGKGSKAARVILGAVGGLVAGAYLGAAIEGNRCACDDPGLAGGLIGAPLGAAAGGILAWRFW